LVGCSPDAEQVSEFAMSVGMWAHGWQALVAEASSDAVHGALVVAAGSEILVSFNEWNMLK
jgi:hypothetical protein